MKVGILRSAQKYKLTWYNSWV